MAGKRRDPIMTWLVLPIITLGIYHFVWWYKINREARDSGVEVSPGMALLALLIGWIIIVPPFVSIYRTGERIAQMQESSGLRPSCNGLIGLILSFFLGLSALYYQIELNRVWDLHRQEPIP